jgi:hypothetical protein
VRCSEQIFVYFDGGLRRLSMVRLILIGVFKRFAAARNMCRVSTACAPSPTAATFVVSAMGLEPMTY